MFTKEKSTIIKGAAIWMMMLHHCFLAGRFEQFGVSFWPFDETHIINLANSFKICVSLFAFVSGYGLYLSYKNHSNELSGNSEYIFSRTSKWIAQRIVKTLSGYWVVVILAWGICMVVDQLPIYAYGFDKSIICGLWNMGLDFLGLSNFFGANPMNGTWWYMSAALVYILLTPVLVISLEKLGSFVTIGLIFVLPRINGGYPGGTNFFSFLPAFFIGMVMAHHDIFNKWNSKWEAQKECQLVNILKFLIMLIVLIIGYKLYYRLPTDKYWDIKWGILPVVLIFFINDYIAHIPGIKQLLSFCGRHSMNVFLTHTFIRYYYYEDFTYSMKHFGVIIIVLLGISLVISVGIEYLKKTLHYDALFNEIK